MNTELNSWPFDKIWVNIIIFSITHMSHDYDIRSFARNIGRDKQNDNTYTYVSMLRKSHETKILLLTFATFVLCVNG